MNARNVMLELYREQLDAALKAGYFDIVDDILRDLVSLSDVNVHDPVRDLRAALIEIGTIWK
jgi:hypothetical protein